MRLVCAAAVLSVTSSFTATFAPSAAARVRLRGSGDDDEAPSVDDADWRAFRAKLIAGGITTTTEETDAEEAVGSGGGGGGVGESGEAVQVTSGLGAGLDPANEALARAQSPSLSDLLTEPSWAHPIGAPEVGSLLLRLPLEVQGQLPSAAGHGQPRAGELPARRGLHVDQPSQGPGPPPPTPSVCSEQKVTHQQ